MNRTTREISDNPYLEQIQLTNISSFNNCSDNTEISEDHVIEVEKDKESFVDRLKRSILITNDPYFRTPPEVTTETSALTEEITLIDKENPPRETPTPKPTTVKPSLKPTASPHIQPITEKSTISPKFVTITSNSNTFPPRVNNQGGYSKEFNYESEQK